MILDCVSAAHKMEIENMLSTMPDGYTIAYAATSEQGSILELVPEGETIEGWTEMITVQVFPNKRRLTLSEFREGLGKLWADTFPGSSSELIEDGYEGSHRVTIWSQAAPLNMQTGKPEMTWFKASVRYGKIAVIQKAFTFGPSSEQVAYWLTFLREVRIRDLNSTSSATTY